MMNNEDAKIHLARELGKMAEQILRKEPPFSNFPIHLEAANHLYLKLLEYSNEIEDSFRQKILEFIIDGAKWFFLDGLVPTQSTFDEQYPQHIETELLFRDWLKQKEENDSPYKSSYAPIHKIEVPKIIKSVVQQRLPEYSFEKTKSRTSVLYFSKSWVLKNKIYIIIDKGSARDFLDFSVGVSTPYLEGINIYHTTIAGFFGGIQCVYSYDSSDEVMRVVNKAIDLAVAVMPHFLERMEKVHRGQIHKGK